MSYQEDVSRPKDSYFQYSFPKGKDAEASIMLSRDPPPGSVTVIVPNDDHYAKAELNGLGDVNNKVFGKKINTYEWDTENYALTIKTADPSTDAYMVMRHLVNVQLATQGTMDDFKSKLEAGNHLQSAEHNGSEVPLKAEAAVSGVDSVKQLAARVGERLQVNIAHTTPEKMDPVQEKAAVDRAGQRENTVQRA